MNKFKLLQLLLVLFSNQMYSVPPEDGTDSLVLREQTPEELALAARLKSAARDIASATLTGPAKVASTRSIAAFLLRNRKLPNTEELLQVSALPAPLSAELLQAPAPARNELAPIDDAETMANPRRNGSAAPLEAIQNPTSSSFDARGGLRSDPGNDIPPIINQPAPLSTQQLQAPAPREEVDHPLPAPLSAELLQAPVPREKVDHPLPAPLSTQLLQAPIDNAETIATPRRNRRAAPLEAIENPTSSSFDASGGVRPDAVDDIPTLPSFSLPSKGPNLPRDLSSEASGYPQPPKALPAPDKSVENESNGRPFFVSTARSSASTKTTTVPGSSFLNYWRLNNAGDAPALPLRGIYQNPYRTQRSALQSTSPSVARSEDQAPTSPQSMPDRRSLQLPETPDNTTPPGHAESISYVPLAERPVSNPKDNLIKPIPPSSPIITSPSSRADKAKTRRTRSVVN